MTGLPLSIKPFYHPAFLNLFTKRERPKLMNMKKVKDFEYYAKKSTRYWWPVWIIAPAVVVIINLLFF